MIYLITGVPGSGKSLYAVGKLLPQMMKERVKLADGTETDRRLVVDGIPGLLLPHDLMAPMREASLIARGKDESDAPAEGHGLWNWYEWCKPGDILCIDEVQRYWRPRGMGTKVPTDIAKLETHRHYGIDIVLITQNPMLVDQNVRRLVGRHLHVRRLFGGSRALIYDWDGCQTDTSRLSGATKTLFTYSRKVFAQYHSAEVHTKQRQKIPMWMAFPLVVAALGAIAGPKAYDAIHKGATGKSITGERSAVAPAGAASGARAPGAASSGPAASPTRVPEPVGKPEGQARKLAGCIASKNRCDCYAADGGKVETDAATCQDASQRVAALPLEFGGRPVAQNAPRGPEKDCYSYIDRGGHPDFGCFDRQDAPVASVPPSSMPPAQGTDGATMAPNGGVGAVRPDSQPQPAPSRNGPARAGRP